MLVVIAVLLFLILNAVTGGKLLESLYATLGLMLLAGLVIANWDVFQALFLIILGILAVWASRTLLSEYKRKSKKKAPTIVLPNAEEREVMIGESTEIEDRIYAHDSGLFLVRGKRGGSKAFRTLEGAQNARGR